MKAAINCFGKRINIYCAIGYQITDFSYCSLVISVRGLMIWFGFKNSLRVLNVLLFFGILLKFRLLVFYKCSAYQYEPKLCCLASIIHDKFLTF
jgi:hypothetical protein